MKADKLKRFPGKRNIFRQIKLLQCQLPSGQPKRWKPKMNFAEEKNFQLTNKVRKWLTYKLKKESEGGK